MVSNLCAASRLSSFNFFLWKLRTRDNHRLNWKWSAQSEPRTLLNVGWIITFRLNAPRFYDNRTDFDRLRNLLILRYTLFHFFNSLAETNKLVFLLFLYNIRTQPHKWKYIYTCNISTVIVIQSALGILFFNILFLICVFVFEYSVRLPEKKTHTFYIAPANTSATLWNKANLNHNILWMENYFMFSEMFICVCSCTITQQKVQPEYLTTDASIIVHCLKFIAIVDWIWNRVLKQLSFIVVLLFGSLVAKWDFVTTYTLAKGTYKTNELVYTICRAPKTYTDIFRAFGVLS